LTDYRGHSHHLYFTNPGWHDGGRQVVFTSDRSGYGNVYLVEVPEQFESLPPLEQ